MRFSMEDSMRIPLLLTDLIKVVRFGASIPVVDGIMSVGARYSQAPEQQKRGDTPS